MSNVIYIGGRVDCVYENQVFVERPTKLIEKLKEKYPLIGYLFVPVKDLQSAQDGIATKGSIYWQANQQVKEGGRNE